MGLINAKTTDSIELNATSVAKKADLLAFAGPLVSVIVRISKSSIYSFLEEDLIFLLGLDKIIIKLSCDATSEIGALLNFSRN